MDKIFIKNFEIFANHGVFQEEKILGQKFILDIELRMSTREAAITSDLSKSVHYGELAHKVESFFKQNTYDLIESAAENVAEFILKEYPLVNEVCLKVKKPWAPIHRTLDTVYIEIVRSWNTAYVSFGSNLGDKEQNIKNGLNIINSSEHTKITKISKIIETEPWGYQEQDTFLNGVCEVRTLLPAKELLDFLMSVEKELKRERIIKWGPRTLDLDIIFYNNLITEDDEIVLPHPRMHMREFVLVPLNELAPYKIHPLYKKRVFELLEKLNLSKES